jgi:hypothetical protein
VERPAEHWSARWSTVLPTGHPPRQAPLIAHLLRRRYQRCRFRHPGDISVRSCCCAGPGIFIALTALTLRHRQRQ